MRPNGEAEVRQGYLRTPYYKRCATWGHAFFAHAADLQGPVGFWNVLEHVSGLVRWKVGKGEGGDRAFRHVVCTRQTTADRFGGGRVHSSQADSPSSFFLALTGSPLDGDWKEFWLGLFRSFSFFRAREGKK